ncbi:hypothetical protein SAMN02745911_2430 [Aureimonas altamirensis DSM 21988]|uniref:Catalase n=2 Tax=Aureimonas altamirensis TaxID=370622 RepID=A0A0P0YXH5_9HYPH|nr:catalase family protein [Aureimonas altamirensis]BAT26256.1 catalase [Aureimonas altamirensis]SHJ42319.1 hypothetical protein SAMN02745911_2430 [Aureimonas altamirensis DSM 21988]
MTLSPPVAYRDDVEDILEGEDETVASINKTFDHVLETTATDYGRAVRAVHAKAHGIIEGRMTVLDGLPPELAQGLFATSGTYPVILRLSTNAGDILDDAISLPRGLAMKVVGVKGERLAGAEGETQDFVMVNGKVFQAKTANQFLRSLKGLALTTDRLDGTKKAVSTILRGVSAALKTLGVESSAINSLGGAPNVDPLGETYYSVTPFRYGDYIAKFSLAPVSDDLLELKGNIVDTDGRPDAIRETVQAEMKTRAPVWEFRVQLCRDLDKQPVEDSTKAWTEDEAPFVTVARIEAGPQDSWSDDKVASVDAGMRFSVWTGLSAHRPLGNINRARRLAYLHSSEFRQKYNRCPIHEPTKL